MVAALAVSLGLVGTAQQQVLIIAQGTDATMLDAPLATDSPSASVYSHISEGLFELTVDGRVVPKLAESFEVSADGLAMTIRLRRGILFHDGTQLDAAAVKFNLDRFIDPATGAAFRFLLFPAVNRVEVVDSLTVRIVLNQPYAPLMANLSHSSLAIQSPAAIRSLGARYGDNPVGTGPFRFVSWVKGQRIDLARFDQYWGERPGVAGVRFLAVPEGTTRMSLVETGQAHVAVRVPPQDVARLEANPNVNIVRTSSVRTTYLYFNFTKSPYTDVRVRRAINHAINKQEIVEFVVGAARVSDAAIAPGIFGYTPVGVYEYNPERARTLLREAGFPNGFEATLHCPTGRYLQDIQACEAIQSQLAEVGVRVRIVTMEWGAYLTETRLPLDRNPVQMGVLAWGTVTGDADYGLYALFHSSQVPPNFNLGGYNNPEVDRLLAAARVNRNMDQRREQYAQALRLIYEDAAWSFLWSFSDETAVRTNVQGFVVHPTERYLAHQASLR
jgi:peptide/nickel transport system substrate-binding protein